MGNQGINRIKEKRLITYCGAYNILYLLALFFSYINICNTKIFAALYPKAYKLLIIIYLK